MWAMKHVWQIARFWAIGSSAGGFEALRFRAGEFSPDFWLPCSWAAHTESQGWKRPLRAMSGRVDKMEFHELQAGPCRWPLHWC